MAAVNRAHPEGASQAWAEQEAAIERFEQAWQRGERPTLEDYLPAATPNRRQCLMELIQADLECRLKAGERARVEGYLASYPDLRSDGEQVVALLLWEYEQRRPHEPELTAGEYAQRFPEHAAQFLRRLGEQEAGLTVGLPSPPMACGPGQPLAAGLPDAIGKYRVVERLGSGGQGEVFRAVHPHLPGRDVVIKWARQALPPAAQRQLLDEGRVLARLDDTGLVRVHDVDVYEGRPFIVFEYVAGRSLRDQLRQRLPPPRQAAALVARLARTLDRVHRQGVLHRDLKPANVLLDAAGRPRLLDFGLAWMHDPFREPRGPGDEVSGTPAYMAPEQAHGRGEQMSARTDVFGLGAVLYELLTGRAPYQDADPLTAWERARQGSIVPPRRQRPGIPRPLERICLKALARAPEDRYPSAGHLARALEHYLRRRLVVAGLAAAVLVLAGVLGLGWWASSSRDGRPAPGIPLAITQLEVQHYRGDPARLLGALGIDRFATRLNDDVQVHARLNQPAYCYLVAFNPDGQEQACYPEDEHVPPPQSDRIDYPADPSEYFGLTYKTGGLQAFVLLVSRQPLPAYAAWRPQVGPLPWRPIQADGVWRFEGERLERLSGERGTVRGHGDPAQAFADVCRRLKECPGVDAIRGLAFPVQPPAQNEAAPKRAKGK